MPNHVFAHISVEKKYADKLREISKVGLCRHYLPMPKELELFKWYKKTHPNHQYGKEDWFNFQEEQKEWLVKQKKSNMAQHGAEDWYMWAINTWGTKWGCYETQFDEDDERAHYSFSTAWSPVSPRIMDMFMKDIPSFIYDWEEEQGYGEYHEIKDGEFTEFHEWGLPEWDYQDEYDQLYKLKKPYEKCGKTYRTGFYLDACLESFVGDRLEDALKRVEESLS